MKRLIALALAACALAAVAGQAQAAGSPEQRIAALERQVAALAGPRAQGQTPADRKIAALQRRVTALEKKVKALETTARTATQLGALAIVYAGCLSAVTSDALAGTWNVVDQIAQALQARTYFGPQAPVSDQETCQTLRITRQTSIPPSVASFSALTALLAGRF